MLCDGLIRTSALSALTAAHGTPRYRVSSLTRLGPGHLLGGE